MNRIQLSIVLLLTVCLALTLINPGVAQQGNLLAGLILNGDFEGQFYPYGSGQVAQYWVPYDYNLGPSPPQYLRSTLYKHDGAASQQIWSDSVPWSAGIMQTTVLTSGQSGVRVQAGKRYTVHAWVYSIYGGPGSPVQNDKLNKRVGIHPSGGTNPKAADIVWTPWHGADKVWIQINCAAQASGNRLTIFIEADDPKSGGQDQVYIDQVWLEEEGAPTPTRTPTKTRTPTAMPTPTATPAIAVLRSINVGDHPQGIGVMLSMNRFFVANNGENTVSSLEGFFDWQHTKLPSGGQRPSNVAVDSGQCRMYVANTGTNNTAVFNICANSQIGSVPLGSGCSPDGIAVLTTTNTIYVANATANSVSVINGDTLTVSKTIPVGTLPGQIAVNPHTNKVYVTNRGYPSGNAGGVTVINANTQSVHKTIDLSASAAVPAPEPYGVAVNSLTNRVYVASASGKLVIIDGERDEVVRAVSPPVASRLNIVAVNPASNNVFVSSTSGNMVFVYDADMEIWSYTVTVGTSPSYGLAVNPLTYQVLVSNPNDNRVSLIRDFGIYQPIKLWLPIVLR